MISGKGILMYNFVEDIYGSVYLCLIFVYYCAGYGHFSFGGLELHSVRIHNVYIGVDDLTNNIELCLLRSWDI